MGRFEPPLPSSGSEPAPPNLAQRLVANAGYTVYEGGTGLFDEPVLVYVGVGRMTPMEFTIYDHVGERRGTSRRPDTRWLFREPPIQLNDQSGHPQMDIRSWWMLFASAYQVDGVASATFALEPHARGPFGGVGESELTIRASKELLCSIRGGGFTGLMGGELTAYDHNGRAVAAIMPSVETIRDRRTTCYVASIEPGLGGELRRLLVAAPVVIAGIGQRN